MKISLLDKFIKWKKLYHFLYGILSTLILVIIIIYLLVNKHQVIYTYDGVIKDNLIEINNLNELDLLNITNCKSIMINNEKIKYDLKYDVFDNKYLIKLYLKNYKINKSLTKINFLEKEESMLRFIINSMKGEQDDEFESGRN